MKSATPRIAPPSLMTHSGYHRREKEVRSRASSEIRSPTPRSRKATGEFSARRGALHRPFCDANRVRASPWRAIKIKAVTIMSNRSGCLLRAAPRLFSRYRTPRDFPRLGDTDLLARARALTRRVSRPRDLPLHPREILCDANGPACFKYGIGAVERRSLGDGGGYTRDG